MKRHIYKLFLVPAVLWAGVCEDNLFAHVIYGRATANIVLDSADWDPKDGGDRNEYTYDVNNHIQKNHRLTGSSDEMTNFTAITSDSLTWSNAAGTHGIRYFQGGLRSIWNDGYGSWIQDSMWTVGDTVKWKKISQYGTDPLESMLKVGFHTESGYRYIVVTVAPTPADTGVFECTETATKCGCLYEGIATVDFERKIAGSILSDTMWQMNTAQHALYFHIPSGASIAQTSKVPKGTSKLLRFFDLVGRLRD